MARHKSFGSENPYIDAEPITFDIYGETFNCVPAVQGSVLLRFTKDMSDDPNTALLNFFKLCMLDEDYERFEELIESPDRIVDATTLGEIAGFIVSEYSARPTGRSSSSADGRTNTGRGSGKQR